MSASLLLPRISTNVRFAASALLFPELADAWAERLFLTPPRTGGAAAALDLIDARASCIEHHGRQIATWRRGRRARPRERQGALRESRAGQPTGRSRRLLAPLCALVLDAGSRASRHADRDRGALRRAVGRHGSCSALPAARRARARDP